MFANSAFSALPLSTLSGSLFGSSVAEVVALNDQINTSAVLRPSILEGASAFGAYYMVGESFHTVIDQASVSQLRQLGGGFSAGSMSSGPYSGLGDTPSVVSGDLFFAQTTVIGFTTESAVALDSVLSRGESFITVAENASGIDNSIGNIDFVRTFSDGATQSDAILGNPAFSSTVVDAASVVEDVSSILTYNLLFIESASGADVISATYTVNSVVDETAVMQDEALTKIVGNATVITSASYTDFVTSSVVFQTNVVTSAHTLDQISARLQWEPVPTDSPTVWTLINTLS